MVLLYINRMRTAWSKRWSDASFMHPAWSCSPAASNKTAGSCPESESNHYQHKKKKEHIMNMIDNRYPVSSPITITIPTEVSSQIWISRTRVLISWSWMWDHPESRVVINHWRSAVKYNLVPGFRNKEGGYIFRVCPPWQLFQPARSVITKHLGIALMKGGRLGLGWLQIRIEWERSSHTQGRLQFHMKKLSFIVLGWKTFWLLRWLGASVLFKLLLSVA